jgi:acyl-CoA thioesterase FadM
MQIQEEIKSNDPSSLSQKTAPEDWRWYEHTVRVTFCHTNAEGNMSHDDYARLFGVVRELMGLELIPRFKEEAGSRYLLKTKNAHYDYRYDFRFGDTIRVRMGVAEVTGASFTMQAEFINAVSGNIHAVGRQKIVYADIEGHPRRLPQELRKLLMMLLNEAVDNSMN